MKKIISEKALRGMIRKQISEALRYDKSERRYFPSYTGNQHSDAGKLAANNNDETEYSHNDYQWSNLENQRNFEDLQWMNGVEPGFDDTDVENHNNAADYLNNHKSDTVVDNAVKKLEVEFSRLLENFLDKAKETYPIFRNSFYMGDLTRKLYGVLLKYDYY